MELRTRTFLFCLLISMVLEAAYGQDACSTKTLFLNCFRPSFKTGQDYLPVQLPLDPHNTPVACAARCKEQGYVYTGTMNGTLCFCGNTEPWGVSRINELLCKTPCPGDEQETCGGNNAIKVFYVFKDGCDWARVIQSDEHTVGRYHASNVLINGCGDSNTHHTVGNVTWWLPPRGGSFTVEFGCKKMVDRVVLKQTHAFPNTNRGSEFQASLPKVRQGNHYINAYGRATDQFCVEVSEEGEYWHRAICGRLRWNSGFTCASQGNDTVIFTFPARTVKFGRFRTIDNGVWTYGAALEFFDLRGPPTC